MEQQLQFIQNQMWFLIALFVLLIASNIVCYFVRKGEKNSSPNFGDMWDKDQLDELVRESRKYLIEYPNNVGALFFGAKALIARNESLSVARNYLEKLLLVEPTLKDSVQELLDELDEREGS